MLTKRLIPCLDVKDGRVVKGENFVDLKDQGDPVKMARDYNTSGADELVFLDITATKENRETIKNLAVEVSKKLFIPFTVGGGIKSIADFKDLIQAGADKVAINSAAVRDPDLITRAAKEFGSQAVVVAIDARKKASGDGWEVLISGGSQETGLDLIVWAKKVEELGAGEILLTSIDADGTKAGYDLEQLKAVSKVIGIPLIASGGAGSPEDLSAALTEGEADAVLAASIWHQDIHPIKDCKRYLLAKGLPIRPVGEDD